MVSDAEYDRLEETWEKLYDRICDLLEQYGEEDSHVPGDYWVVDSFWGYAQAKVYINNLGLLNPTIVKFLQKVLSDFPGWEVVATVCVRGTESTWPEMGLLIHAKDVTDDLRREYLPPEFQTYRY